MLKKIPNILTIGRIIIVNNTKIEIKDLYKIFGPNPKSMLDKVKTGISKQELLEKYNHTVGLQDINIDMPACGIQVIMGLSGAGKSTLIRHINRLIDPTSGKIIVDGEDVLAMEPKELRNFRKFKASMVFQKFSLFPHRTVNENVAYGLKIQFKNQEEINKISAEWIQRVGLGGFENHYPAQLSGGMQQRVGLIRALATNPDILLMDEAFSALDPLIRSDMQNILLDLQKELKKAKTKTDASAIIGASIASKAKQKKISEVVFDRNGNPYHGRIKALAEAAREAGLKF